MFLKSFPERGEFRRLAAEANVIPVATVLLADMETPVSVLHRFQAACPGVFLLESVEGGERWGRYSFMGLSAHSRIRVMRETVDIEKDGKTRSLPHGNRPLDVLRQLMASYKLADMPDRPRFCGGLVGYMTYEMAHFFEPKVPNKLPPEEPLAEFMLPDTLLIFDNVLHSLTIMALAFTTAGEDPDRAYDRSRARIDQMVAALAAAPPPEEAPAGRGDESLELVPGLSGGAFRQRVSAVGQAIREGEVIQTVLSQSFSCPAPADPVAVYRAQRHVNPSPYMYFLRFDDRSLIGSSPETMVRLENRVACLRPIAGTRGRGTSETEDRALADELLRDEKERAEHLMLVDLGRNELGRIAGPGSVQVTDLMVVERYSHVMHLVSNITADLAPEHDGFDLVASSFPAGTLTGAPKVRAMELIAGLEPEPRGAYGGAVGYFAFNGNLDFAICIRTAYLAGGRLTVRAGAGIVADSDPERERLETVAKAGSVARALELLGRGPVS